MVYVVTTESCVESERIRAVLDDEGAAYGSALVYCERSLTTEQVRVHEGPSFTAVIAMFPDIVSIGERVHVL
jgi:hypothetical protein